jgi:hypothetical protein
MAPATTRSSCGHPSFPVAIHTCFGLKLKLRCGAHEPEVPQEGRDPGRMRGVCMGCVLALLMHALPIAAHPLPTAAHNPTCTPAPRLHPCPLPPPAARRPCHAPHCTLPLRTCHGTMALPPLPASVSPPRSALPHALLVSVSPRTAPHRAALPTLTLQPCSFPAATPARPPCCHAPSRPVSTLLHRLPLPASTPPRHACLSSQPYHSTRSRIGPPVTSRLCLATAHNLLLVAMPFPSCNHAAIRAGWGRRVASVRPGAALMHTLAELTVPCRLAGCRCGEAS